MANKNITMRQKNNAGSYDKLYPKTTATQSKLSAATAALYGDGVTDADAAMRIVANTIKDLGFVTVIVKDPSGNPIQGAIITGIQGSPATDANGKASGILQSATITVNSPYVDLQPQTISVSGSVSSINVTLPIVGENAIKRFTSSQSVKFSNVIKTVDVCCVGGGGGGGAPARPASSYSYTMAGGGGGGGIVNGLNLSIQKNTPYSLIVGAGGAAATDGINATSGKDGGLTSLLNVIANGGLGGGNSGGAAGSVGSGAGGSPSMPGSSNTTLSEFNDGLTFYSGGGAGGVSSAEGAKKGGAPNGADGAWLWGNSKNATTAGKGGGGGGGGKYVSDSILVGHPSAGGSGLVAIRFHF